MLFFSLLTIPFTAVFAIITALKNSLLSLGREKSVAIMVSIANISISLAIYVVNLFSTNQYQLVEEYHKIGNLDFYFGIDGLSIFFVILIAIITPVALLSNWNSIKENTKSFLIIMLLLETLLLTVFLVLDTLLFYIFFESILPPLFLLIGMFGSKNRVRAGFYLFLYTLLGSLFLLLCILNTLSLLGNSDFDTIYQTNIMYYIQIFVFCGIFIAFAVKTPTIFLNTWLLKAHVESPLGGSIILAAIVLKLSLYGILRLILPMLHKAYVSYTPTLYTVGVITILYASVSTLRTIDIKELIAYSSVSHASVYLVGILSSILQGIQGGILLGLGHGFVSSGLFICTGGVLYDRSSTRLISFYRGFTQIMPLFIILFFILCLGNAGTPLSLNFVGEFLSLYGTFERMPSLGAVACSSIVFSAAYTFYMFNRIAFAGTLSEFFIFNLPDLSKREFNILLILVIFTVTLGIYPAPVLDGLQYSTSLIIYNLSSLMSFCDTTATSGIEYTEYSSGQWEKLTDFKTDCLFYLVVTTFAVASVTSIHLLSNCSEKANKGDKLTNYAYPDKNYEFLPELLNVIVSQPLNTLTVIFFLIRLFFTIICKTILILFGEYDCTEEIVSDLYDSFDSSCDINYTYYINMPLEEAEEEDKPESNSESDNQDDPSSQPGGDHLNNGGDVGGDDNDNNNGDDNGNKDNSDNDKENSQDQDNISNGSENDDNNSADDHASDGTKDDSSSSSENNNNYDDDSNGGEGPSGANRYDSEDEGIPDAEASTSANTVRQMGLGIDDEIDRMRDMVKRYREDSDEDGEARKRLKGEIADQYDQVEQLESAYPYASREHSHRTVETMEERMERHADVLLEAEAIWDEYRTAQEQEQERQNEANEQEEQEQEEQEQEVNKEEAEQGKGKGKEKEEQEQDKEEDEDKEGRGKESYEGKGKGRARE